MDTEDTATISIDNTEQDNNRNSYLCPPTAENGKKENPWTIFNKSPFSNDRFVTL
jgi:hypothetical protein